MKVLIVEDEELERKAMKHLLEEYFPQIDRVLTAEDGLRAVKVALEQKPELLLMDIKLPRLDGIAAAGRIREKQPETQIIMVSAYSDYEHMRGAIRNQALDYLVKPYSVESFQEAIGRGLRRLTLNTETEVYGRAGIVRAVQQYIEKYYQKNITLKDIAEQVCLDKSYLGRIFKEETQITVMGYLKEVRLKHACELLLRGMAPSEVAVRTGFGDPAYFAKSFKQEKGISPVKYRELHRQEQVNRMI